MQGFGFGYGVLDYLFLLFAVVLVFVHEILGEFDVTIWALNWEGRAFGGVAIEVDELHGVAAVNTGEHLLLDVVLVFDEIVQFLRHVELGLEHVLQDRADLLGPRAEPEVHPVAVQLDVLLAVAAPDNCLGLLPLHQIILFNHFKNRHRFCCSVIDVMLTGHISN